MKIGIIDSGADRIFAKDYSLIIKSAFVFKENPEKISLQAFEYNNRDISEWLKGRSDILSDEIGHGTAVLSIISKKYPDAEYYIAKMIDYKNDYYSRCLLESLRWMVEKAAPDIINISYGTVDSGVREELYQLTKRGKEKGIKIYAAGSSYLSYPAVFDTVITVTDTRTIDSKCHWIMQMAVDKIVSDEYVEIWRNNEWIKDHVYPGWASAMVVED